MSKPIVLLRQAALLGWASIFSLGVRPAAAQVVAEPEVYSLQRAIQVALGSSHMIAAAEEGVSIADQQVREAWSNVFPDIVASASYARNLQVQQGFLPARLLDPTAPEGAVTAVRFGSDNTWGAGLTIEQPLFEYDVFVGVGAAKRFRNLESERLRFTTQDVVTSVRRTYLGALLLAEEYRLIQNSLARTESTLEETRALNRAGLTGAYDVLRLEVQVANLEPNLRRVRNAADAAKRLLLIELGLPPTEEIRLEGSLAVVDIAEGAVNDQANATLLSMSGLPVVADLHVDDLLALALDRRSELLQGRLIISLEETRLQSQRGEFFPSVTLFGNYNIAAQEDGALTFFGGPNNRTTASAVGLRVSLPLFQGMARPARIQQTAATVRRNEVQLERLEREVENEIRTMLANLDEAQLRVASQRRAVAQAQRGFEIASAEYREGIGSQLQITDAENALRETEFNYAEAVFDYLIARTGLDAAVGTVPIAAGELAVRASDRGE
jgi:outer membrane protein TolC